MYFGIDGQAKHVVQPYFGVDGIAKKALKVYVGDENGEARLGWELPLDIPIGSTYTITTSQYWECPATGKWNIEMHGGGGGGGTNALAWKQGGGGGGSGEIYENIKLSKNAIYWCSIGDGGYGGGFNSSGSDGVDSIFQTTPTLYARGGKGGGTDDGGAAGGSIASAGQVNAGGKGNVNNQSQTYGNGGDGGSAFNYGKKGQSGAIILTYMGI